MGPFRAAGVFCTGSTSAVLPLAPFHGTFCTGLSNGSAATGGGGLPQAVFFAGSRSRRPARICFVLSFSCGNCISCDCWVPGLGACDGKPVSAIVCSPVYLSHLVFCFLSRALGGVPSLGMSFVPRDNGRGMWLFCCCPECGGRGGMVKVGSRGEMSEVSEAAKLMDDRGVLTGEMSSGPGVDSWGRVGDGCE